jgi:16S rRNA (cytosine1402-N4)-methyltransferase
VDETSGIPPAQPTDGRGRTNKRRPRYSGKYPRRFDEKYKELNPERFAKTVQKVLDSGKTPAGTHRPIMVEEILEVLEPRPGESAIDCTLGYGGHTRALLERVLPGGRIIAIDQDPIELPKTEARLRAAGFGPGVLTCHRGNFAGLIQIVASSGLAAVDMVLADLGVSSMQLDDPLRGFSIKQEGPLDMRMNPRKGPSATDLLRSITPERLTKLLAENADEPFAQQLGTALAGRHFESTRKLAAIIRSLLPKLGNEQAELSIRRTFQALRIAVNNEFSALKELLRQAPACLNPRGRIAVLSFHSGEDRLVKAAFAEGLRSGIYAEVSREVRRPGEAECYANPRAAAAKLRWARVAAHISQNPKSEKTATKGGKR